jgi:tetratricopeptide (TPR) repeat protein
MERPGDRESEVEIFLEELNRAVGADDEPARGFQCGGPNEQYVAFLRRRFHVICRERAAALRSLEALDESQRALQRAEEVQQTLWRDHLGMANGYRALEQDHARLEDAWRALDREHARLTEAHKELQDLHRRLFDAHLALESDCWRAHAANAELTRALHDIRSSWAWKLLGGLRRLKGVARRLARRLKFWR